MKTIMRSVLVGVAVVLAGCATTTAELTSTTENMQTWTVSAPVETVFKAYKGYAEQHFNGTVGLLGDHLSPIAHFYGDNAELSVRHVGNPLANITYLHFTMEQSGDSTAVKAWHYNEPWRRNVDKFRELLPSQ